MSSVQTTVPQNHARDLALVQYAYGGAQQVFDPVADRFVFPGYRRQVVLVPTSQQEGQATFHDTYGPTNPDDPYNRATESLTAAQRYARYLRVGRVSDVTVLAGNVGTDPAALVTIDPITDARRISNTHYEYDARSLTAASDPAGPELCSEMVYPYDYAGSQGVSSVDACRWRGFAFVTSIESSRGEPGAPLRSAATVTTRSEIRPADVDDFGRTLIAKQLGDVAPDRTDDDVCINTTFATPSDLTGASARVLTAVATQSVTNCGLTANDTTTYAKETWVYDHMNTGDVSAGLVTAHLVERHDEAGNLLGTPVRAFDASYNAQANPSSVSTTRGNDTRTVSVTYDAFQLAPVIIKTSATNLSQLRTDLTRDPLSLLVTTARDPNGTSHSTSFDGFDRPFMTKMKPPNGTEGALSYTTFLGFAGGDAQGRRVTAKVFTDPVAPNTASTATGRTATVYLDELGRERITDVVLGDKYPGVTIKTGDRTYDSLGRVVFEADPYPSNQDAATAFGTTRYFRADGTLKTSIRGKGLQPNTTEDDKAPVTDEANEIYPTYFFHSFSEYQVKVRVNDAAALVPDTSAPQHDVAKGSAYTATGRLLGRRTYKGSATLEAADFGYDRLGHLTSMTRYQDPSAAGSKPVTSGWHFDSLGQVLELDEPESVPLFNTYSNWGELLETTRTVAGSQKKVIKRYDALSRMIHSEHQIAGVVDAETVNDYAYDTAVSVAPQVDPTFVLGRLAQATWPTGSATFSYDAFGRTNARVFTDTQNRYYVEKHTLHADGTPSALDLFLPDTAYADEHVDYTFDSAARGRTVTYQNGSSQSLFDASIIDALGRVREAHYGQATYAATYADFGRRLLSDVSVSSSQGSRSISYQNLDPVGRERGRTEVKNGDTANAATTTWTYDALGRLSSALQTHASTTDFNQQFTYDPLGNVLSLINVGGTTNTMSYSATDRDRICHIAYGADNQTACNVTYDELGAILSQPTATGSRQYSYLLDGAVRTITDNRGSRADFRYDAFGNVQELGLTSSASPDTREPPDRHFGSLITQRTLAGSPIYVRTIPGPDGSIATRRGPAGPWVFQFGENRGNRFFTDENGKFVQDVDYEPFGKPSPTGAQAGSTLYSNEQWNGGDALAAFGISQLGARLYDPAIGRFVSRDPLLIPRTAATTNSYAFANNDPVNSSDPSGLSTQPGCALCTFKNEDGNTGTGPGGAGMPVDPYGPSGDPGGSAPEPPLSPPGLTPPTQPPSENPIDLPPLPPGRGYGDAGGRGDNGGAGIGGAAGGSPVNDAQARSMFGQAPYSATHRPPEVDDLDDQLDMKKWTARAVVGTGTLIQIGGEALGEAALDMTPGLGTYRRFQRGTTSGAH